MLGNVIKVLRAKKNIMQKDLAEVMEVSPSTISMWENGEREPDIVSLKKIADYFDVSMDYLLERVDNRNDFYYVNGNNSVQVNGNNSTTSVLESEPTFYEDTLTKKFVDIFSKLDFDKQLSVMNFTMNIRKEL